VGKGEDMTCSSVKEGFWAKAWTDNKRIREYRSFIGGQ